MLTPGQAQNLPKWGADMRWYDRFSTSRDLPTILSTTDRLKTCPAMRECYYLLFQHHLKRRQRVRRTPKMAEQTEPQTVAESKPPAIKDKPQPVRGENVRELKSAPAETRAPARQQDSWRETVESVVVAFVLAFLFRTFEAEAFVIPTGSMAPTLYGQHRDIYCEKCGTRFAVGASSGSADDAEIRDGKVVSGYRTHFALCPNAGCRFPNDVLAREIFAGDRILVNKFPYEFGTPDRWDVGVFKFPQEAKTNYIKRIVGLPGEELRLEAGDVYVRPLNEPGGVFRIARKTPEKQRLLQMLVHDNDHPARALLSAGWPESWSAENEGQWAADAEERAFRVDPDFSAAGSVQWLRYRHYIPTATEWTRVLNGKPLVGRPQRQYVGDFYAYNSKISAGEAAGAVNRGELPEVIDRGNGSQWVGDLTLNCSVEVLSPEGEVIFELSEGSERFRCTVDLKTGQGTFARLLERDQDELKLEMLGESFETGMSAAGEYAITFANVDDRLCLWVDNRLVKTLEFEVGSRFELENPRPTNPTPWDYEPAGIGARGAKARVSHLLLQRDVYYRNEGLAELGSDRGNFQLADREDDREDEFLALGDNSPRSKDSRLWEAGPAVPRKLLIGKAFFIYWPHAIPFLNGGRGFPVMKYEDQRGGPPLPKLSLPFYPQAGRMKRIR